MLLKKLYPTKSDLSNFHLKMLKKNIGGKNLQKTNLMPENKAVAKH